jgi:hypothetical protein
MSNLPELKRRTKQALAAAKQAVLHDAAEVVAAHGPAGLIVTHLAKKHDVAPLTVRRWLLSHGHDLQHLTRGRPSFSKIDGLQQIKKEGDQ